MPRSGFPKKDLYGENPKSTHNATFPVSPVELKRLTWRNSRPTTTTPYNLARDPPRGVFLAESGSPPWVARPGEASSPRTRISRRSRGVFLRRPRRWIALGYGASDDSK